MSISTKIAYTKDKKVIYIENALPKTDYYCIFCGGRLRVRKSKNKIKHFCHFNCNCEGKGESIIHKYWKIYFLNLKNFDGYNIVTSKEEVKLLNGTYFPDIVFKTDKNSYIILEICYKNPKTERYMEKFKKLKKLEKVYEIIVDSEKILDTKILFDIEIEKRIEQRKKDLQEEIEKIRHYILNKYYLNGGLIFDTNHQMPYSKFILHKELKPKYRYSKYNSKYKYIIKSSLKYKKFRVYLTISLNFEKKFLVEKSTPFNVNIYDFENLYQHLNYFLKAGEVINFEIGEIINKDIRTLLNDQRAFINIYLSKK